MAITLAFLLPITMSLLNMRLLLNSLTHLWETSLFVELVDDLLLLLTLARELLAWNRVMLIVRSKIQNIWVVASLL